MGEKGFRYEYQRPSMTVDALVLAGQGPTMQLLLIERAHEPYTGAFALPGGFVDPFENPFHAVLRELAEETGGKPPRDQQWPLQLRARKGRDPRGWTISQPYLFWVAEPFPVKGGDDARRAEWVHLANLDELAFDHGAMLCEALGRFWPEMPSFEPRLKGIAAYGYRATPHERAIFYGGSFNPWHEGHDACIAACPNSQLIVVPDSNPFKETSLKGCYWAAYRAIATRLAPLKLAIYPGFFGSELPNPTVAWLPFTPFQQRELLCGDDSFASLPSWIEAKTLAQALDKVRIVPRCSPQDVLDRASAWFKQNAPHCVCHFHADHPYRSLSSTALRGES